MISNSYFVTINSMLMYLEVNLLLRRCHGYHSNSMTGQPSLIVLSRLSLCCSLLHFSKLQPSLESLDIMSRFQTTYTRDFGKDRIVSTSNSVFREECHPFHYDSGVASDEDEDDISQNYHNLEAVHKDCLGPCKASSLAYIHHISPKEHNQRHSCKCFDEPKPQLCQREIPERQQKSHYSLGSSERWYNKLNDHARETQELINKSEKVEI